MILDLHLHSEASDDSRAPVEAYLKILARKRAERQERDREAAAAGKA